MLLRLPSVYGAYKRRNPLLCPYCPVNVCDKQPFYFQEVAIREVIKRLMYGQKRYCLLWPRGLEKHLWLFKLYGSSLNQVGCKGYILKSPPEFLFLADRVVLRDQAYNTFSPFADGNVEPRCKIDGHNFTMNRDLYFGIYQTLWSPDGQGIRLFKKFPPDFFDLVIIDECHRSGFWHMAGNSRPLRLSHSLRNDGYAQTRREHRYL